MRNLNLIDKAFLLKKTSFFEALDLDLLLTIAEKMESVHLRAEEKVFQFDQDAYRMFLIVSGQIVIQDKAKKTLSELSTGDFFGDEAMFNDQKRAYEAICKTNCELLTLSRSHLLSIIAECPSVAISLLEAYASKLDFRPR